MGDEHKILKDEDVNDFVKTYPYKSYIFHKDNCQLSLKGILKLIFLGCYQIKYFSFDDCDVVYENMKEICDFIINNKLFVSFCFTNDDADYVLCSYDSPLDHVYVEHHYGSGGKLDLLTGPLSYVKRISYHPSFEFEHNDIFDLISNSCITSFHLKRFDMSTNYLEKFLSACVKNKHLKELSLRYIDFHDDKNVTTIISFIDQHISLRFLDIFGTLNINTSRKFREYLRKNTRLHGFYLLDGNIGKKVKLHLRQNRKMHFNVQYICAFLCKPGM